MIGKEEFLNNKDFYKSFKNGEDYSFPNSLFLLENTKKREWEWYSPLETEKALIL